MKLSKSLIRTDCMFTVLITSSGLVKGRILSTRGKGFGGACSKLGGEMCTVFGGQT